ncbi:MAG: tetratricopeptide repeat protein [Gemmatimonadota bacterium]|jgi:serine/threonine-protein kinase
MFDLSILQRLKERKLVQWALAYLAGGFVILQILDAVAEPLSLSALFQRAILVLLGMGLLLTLVLAWFHGEKGRQRVSGTELLMVFALLVITGGALVILHEGTEVSDSTGTSSVSAVADDRPAIAVLPFENYTTDSTFAFFADGMQEEILSTLSGISSIRVISRSSVMQYRDDRPNTRQIAEELGVSHLVEGSAQVFGDQVRLTVQLIDAGQDEHLWSEDYDRELTAGNLFGIRSQVGREIAFQVGVTLTPDEQNRVARVLTENTEAYLMFLEGNQAFLEERVRGSTGSYPSIQILERAVAKDPDFALARAQYARSLSYAGMRFFPDKWNQVREEAETALELLPGLAEARLALARYFQARGEEQEAVRQYQMVLEEYPNSAPAAFSLAEFQQRSGEFDLALGTLKRAEVLSPRDPLLQRTLAWTYIHFHRYEEALQAIDKLQRLQSSDHPILLRAFVNFMRGDQEEARSALSDLIASYPESPHSVLWWAPFSFVRRMLAEDQLRVAFEAYLESDESTEEPCQILTAACLRKATQAEDLGLTQQARVYWDSLAAVMEGNTPLVSQALIFQGLGQKEPAIEAAQTYAVRRTRVDGGSIDRFYAGPASRVFFARVLTHFGESDRAIDILEEELPAPSWLSAPMLEIDPIWDPLRDHPRFQALLEEYRDDVEH